MRWITEPYPEIIRHKQEETYEDPVTNEKQKFPSIDNEPDIQLSVVVPAFDEEARCKLYLPFFLIATLFTK